MPHARVNGTRIHYRSYGAGEAVMLIHGLGSSGADWAFQLPALAPHRRVLVPDLRGSGRSSKPRGAYRMADFAHDLWGLLEHLGIERAALVGFSLGGAVALEMALERPQAVQRLVMINSLPSYRVDNWRKWLEVRLQTGLVRVLGLKRTAGVVARRLFPYPHQAAMRERVSEVVGRNPRRPYLATVRALAGWCALDRLPQLACPTLVIAAEHDYTPLQEKHDIARRLGAELAVIRGSRHGTPFDAIQASNACLLAFLQGEPLPAADLLQSDPPDHVPVQLP